MDTEILVIEYEFKGNELHLKRKGGLVPFKNYAPALWNVLTSHHTNNDDCAEEFYHLMTNLKRAAIPYGRQGIRIIKEITRIVKEHFEFIIKIIDKTNKSIDKRGGDKTNRLFAINRDVDTGKILCLSCNSPPAPEKKLLKCGKCYLAHYCGATCQKEHWKEHKKNCSK
jgi:hypothetical protein